jgi:hypothetical protein
MTLTGCSGTPIISSYTDVNFDYELNPGIDTIEVNSTWVDAGVKLFIDDIEVNVTSINNYIKEYRIGDYQVEYVLEYEGISYKVYRHVKVIDETNPEITLLPGLDTVIIGSEWIDGGVEVTDNSLETLDVIVTGKVNTDVESSYEITYIAIDSSGNADKVHRTVHVVRDNFVAESSIGDVLQGEVGDVFKVKGIVHAKSYYCYMITDGIDHLIIYDFYNLDMINIGDEIVLKGTFNLYRSAPELENSTFEIISVENDYGVPRTKSILDLKNETVQYGGSYLLTGYLELKDGEHILSDIHGNELTLYYRCHTHELKEYLNKYITINVSYITLDVVSYMGTGEDVYVLTDTEIEGLD